ncbi:conserved protein of unknown function [Rhodovastum atsumiense]|nr:conserved protein of unknown function [Rhodovastum atsumiense]
MMALSSLPEPAPVPVLAEPDPPDPPEPRWTKPRIAVADSLWGDGFGLPGGEDEILRLAAPLGLSRAATLLLLGAGAGGPARVLAGTLGAWVSGHEADPALVGVAARKLSQAGADIARRAEVAPWDPAAPALRRRGFHHALTLEALRGTPDRPVVLQALLADLAGALRPGGQLVLVELVAGERRDPADSRLAEWARSEGRSPGLVTAAGLTTALAGVGFDVRVVEDISVRHRRLAIEGWVSLLRGLAQDRPAPARAAATVAEAEIWLQRLRLMQAGHLRLMRWHALGPR